MSIVTRKYTIAAGGSVQFSRKADFLRCLEANGTVTVQFDDGADGGDLEGGLAYFPEGGFSVARMVNNGTGQVTLTIAVGKGSMEDNRATVNTGQILPVREGPPDVITSIHQTGLATSQTTQIAPANPLRKCIAICNDTNYQLFLSDGTTAGLYLPYGQVVVLETTAAISVYNNDATNTGQVRGFELAWSA